jgi:hypothetical protein
VNGWWPCWVMVVAGGHAGVEVVVGEQVVVARSSALGQGGGWCS